MVLSSDRRTMSPMPPPPTRNVIGWWRFMPEDAEVCAPCRGRWPNGPDHASCLIGFRRTYLNYDKTLGPVRELECRCGCRRP